MLECCHVYRPFIYTSSRNAEIIRLAPSYDALRMDTNSLYLTEQINQLGVEVFSRAWWGTISRAWLQPRSTRCFVRRS